MSRHVQSSRGDAIGKSTPVPIIGRLKIWVSALKSVKYIRPTVADVLIVDIHDGMIGECLDPGVTSLDLPVRGEAWLVNFRIIYNLFRYFSYVVAGKIGLRGLYVLAVATSLRTSVVITFIDNNNWDKGLVELDRFRLVCIQNGFRRLPELEGKTFDVYCTLNDLPVHLFGQYGIESNRIIATGSLRLSVFEHMVIRLPSTEFQGVGDSGPLNVLMPSGFRVLKPGSGWATEKIRIQLEGEARICAWLVQMEREGVIKVTVALTTGADANIEEDEIAYYTNLFGYRPKLSRRREDRWASYKAMMHTDVTVGAGSTILLESRELGIPTLFCFSIYSEQHYEFFQLGVVEDEINLLPRDSDYNDFRSAVLKLGEDRNNCARQGRNAVETIGEVVSELLETPTN